MSQKYLFLTGKLAIPKEFENDDAAIAEAKKDPTVIRVQCLKTLNAIHENIDDAVEKKPTKIGLKEKE